MLVYILFVGAVVNTEPTHRTMLDDKDFVYCYIQTCNSNVVDHV